MKVQIKKKKNKTKQNKNIGQGHMVLFVGINGSIVLFSLSHISISFSKILWFRMEVNRKVYLLYFKCTRRI